MRHGCVVFFYIWPYSVLDVVRGRAGRGNRSGNTAGVFPATARWYFLRTWVGGTNTECLGTNNNSQVAHERPYRTRLQIPIYEIWRLRLLQYGLSWGTCELVEPSEALGISHPTDFWMKYGHLCPGNTPAVFVHRFRRLTRAHLASRPGWDLM